MTPRAIKQHCRRASDSQELIRTAMTELNLSARRERGNLLLLSRDLHFLLLIDLHLFLHFLVLFKELIEQLRIHRFVAHRVRLTLEIAGRRRAIR